MIQTRVPIWKSRKSDQSKKQLKKTRGQTTKGSLIQNQSEFLSTTVLHEFVSHKIEVTWARPSASRAFHLCLPCPTLRALRAPATPTPPCPDHRTDSEGLTLTIPSPQSRGRRGRCGFKGAPRPRCGPAPRSAPAHGRMGLRALGAAHESGARQAAPGARGSHGPLPPLRPWPPRW